jgi:hypothetical protein
MNQFSESIYETKMLVNKAQLELEELKERNIRLIDLSEEFVRICDKFLNDTEEK